MESKDRITVVLVDDDSDDRLIFEDAFSKLKIKSNLVQFQNGLEAIQYFEKEDTKVPHIIFLDLNMPIMTGIEALQILRKDKKYRNVPIAIYSTSNAESDKEATLVSGANIYITKPNDYSKLKQVLESVMKIQWQYNSSELRMDTFVMVL